MSGILKNLAEERFPQNSLKKQAQTIFVIFSSHRTPLFLSFCFLYIFESYLSATQKSENAVDITFYSNSTIFWQDKQRHMFSYLFCDESTLLLFLDSKSNGNTSNVFRNSKTFSFIFFSFEFVAKTLIQSFQQKSSEGGPMQMRASFFFFLNHSNTVQRLETHCSGITGPMTVSRLRQFTFHFYSTSRNWSVCVDIRRIEADQMSCIRLKMQYRWP